MNDRLISMNAVLTVIGNLLKDIADEAFQPGELFLKCKGCKFNDMMGVDGICNRCMRNYTDKYEK